MEQAAAAAEAAMAAPSITAEDVKARIEAQLKSALDEAKSMQREQLAEPLYWWDLYAYGPIQFGSLVPPAGFLDSPLQPGRILRVGEKAYLVTVLVINPFPLPQDPMIVPVDFLTVWKLPFTIEYHTVNATHCTPAGTVQHWGYLEPGQAYYVDVLEIDATEPGCVFETNICARILDCHKSTPSPSPFAGFARATINLDPELFLPTQFLEFDNPVRYMVYE
jgi:hypothetical protein